MTLKDRLWHYWAFIYKNNKCPPGASLMLQARIGYHLCDWHWQFWNFISFLCYIFGWILNKLAFIFLIERGSLLSSSTSKKMNELKFNWVHYLTSHNTGASSKWYKKFDTKIFGSRSLHIKYVLLNINKWWFQSKHRTFYSDSEWSITCNV
jgi:hypothetical protein